MTRVLLVLLCLALLLLALLGMRLGWRNRMRRQAGLPALPTAPADLGAPILPSLTGVYVGTTFASSWQDRVLHEGLGLRATATAACHPAGVVIDREGAAPIFIPTEAIKHAELRPALAGKVVGQGGLLVISWRLGDALVDSALRADDKTAYPAWVRQINAEVTAG